MRKKIFFSVIILVVALFVNSKLFAEKKELTKEEIISIATEAVKAEGLTIEGAEIIYDSGNKLWEQQIDKIIVLDRVAAFNVLKKGFLNNYYIVYFNFNISHRDIWVFIDKDTGDVLEVYTK